MQVHKGIFEITVWQYVKLNWETTKFYFSFTTLVFSTILTIVALIIKYTKGTNEEAWEIFLMGEATSFALAIFIYLVVISQGYKSYRTVLHRFKSMRQAQLEDDELTLYVIPRNEKWEFFEIGIGKDTEEGVVLI